MTYHRHLVYTTRHGYVERHQHYPVSYLGRCLGGHIVLDQTWGQSTVCPAFRPFGTFRLAHLDYRVQKSLRRKLGPIFRQARVWDRRNLYDCDDGISVNGMYQEEKS